MADWEGAGDSNSLQNAIRQGKIFLFFLMKRKESCARRRGGGEKGGGGRGGGGAVSKYDKLSEWSCFYYYCVLKQHSMDHQETLSALLTICSCFFPFINLRPQYHLSCNLWEVVIAMEQGNINARGEY